MDGFKRATRSTLQSWLVDALKSNGGSATIVEVCRHVWEEHEHDLRSAGDLFYTWQYDIRWAATKLRKTGVVGPASASPSGIWVLAASVPGGAIGEHLGDETQ
jgi:hypothetical protein